MKKYIALKLFVPEEYQDTFIAMISDLEFTGIEQHNDEITINFPATYYNEDIKNELSSICTNHKDTINILSIEIIEEKNWNEEWEKNLEAVIVNNKLVIAPKNKSDQFTEYKYVIKIDPQMSFGTGYHATTRLASKLLLSTVNDNEKWLDAGTGTGVLAILASKLGAKEVFAFDVEDWAVKNAKENVKINECEGIIIDKLDLNSVHLENYNGIVANIFANILIDNMSKFYRSLSSSNFLICTGILKYDKIKVLEAANMEGFELETEIAEDEWIAYKFRKIK